MNRAAGLLLASLLVIGVHSSRCFLDTQTEFVFGPLELYTAPQSAGQRNSITLNGIQLILKPDGNLQIIELASGTQLWSTGLNTQLCDVFTAGCRCVMQGDGNFVCSTPSDPYWATNTYNCCDNPNAAALISLSSQQPYIQMWNNDCKNVFTASNTLPRTTTTDTFGGTGWVSPTALSTNQFIDSFGVNTHLSQGWDLSTTITEAVYVGTSTIREGIVDNLIPSYKNVTDAGIKLNLIIISNNNPNISDNIRILETAAQNSPGMLTSIEGFNELNNQPFTYDGVDPHSSYAGMAQAQKDFYNGIKASSILKNIPVYDLTGGNSGPDSAALGLNNIAGYADYANIHPYSYNGDQPIVGWSYFSQNMNGDYTTWQLSTPRVITELGWPTLVNSTNSQGVSLLAQAKLSVNAILDSIHDGYRQIFLYELLDEQWGNPQDNEEHFGLFNHDTTPKPVAQVLHLLTGLLKDPSPGSLSSFNFSIDGFPVLTFRYQLFQMQKTPSFWIALWNDVEVWNPMTQQDVQNTPFSLTITIGSNPFFSTADWTIYNPYSDIISGSPPATQTVSNANQVKFQMNDYLMLVQVVPKGNFQKIF